MGLPELYEQGMRQHGAVGRGCARTAGIASAQFIAWARRSQLIEPFPTSFLLPGSPHDARSRSFAAALALGRDAALTGWSALAQLGLTRSWPAEPELLVPASARTVRLPGVRTRWSRALPEASLIVVGNVRVTDPARSLAHVAGRIAPSRLRAMSFDAMTQGSLEPAHLDRELATRRRFHGRGAIRQLASDLRGDGSESGFEFDTRARLVTEGLSPDPDQPELSTSSGRRRRIDIAFNQQLVGIDCVGFAYHSTPTHLEADVVRTNEIAELDRWLILRLTWRMFLDGWPSFSAQVHRCLAARSHPRS